MNGLRPEKDELDRFQSRAKSTKPTKKKPDNKVVESSTRSNTPLVVGVFLLLLLLFGFLSWAYIKQSNDVANLGKDLEDARNFISQSQLLMARFEGELNQAGADLEQTGSAAEEKLKFLDSEMRKLWGLAGDKNRKAIASNKDAVDGLRIKINALEKTQAAAKKKVQEQLSANEALLKQQKRLEQRVANAENEAVLTREALESQVESLAGKVDALSGGNKLSSENAKAIASIDASRRQLNDRIVGLERRLNELKLQIGALKATQ